MTLLSSTSYFQKARGVKYSNISCAIISGHWRRITYLNFLFQLPFTSCMVLFCCRRTDVKKRNHLGVILTHFSHKVNNKHLNLFLIIKTDNNL